MRDLAAAVDLPTPRARAAAAVALAYRPEVSLSTWVAVARAFAPSGAPPAEGVLVETVALPVLDAVESTPIAVYAPRTLAPGKPAPLLLAFHGTGGRGEDVLGMWRATADALGMLVVAPSEVGPNEGYRFSPRERAAALAALRWARRRFDVDEDRVGVTGISRGGHLAWDLALRHPDLFAAVAPMIGAPRVTTVAGGNNLRYVENLLDVPLRDLQGSRDEPHLVANVRLAFQYLDGWKARDAKLFEFPDRGHDFDFAAVDWKAFLGGARRDAHPVRALRRASSPEEARAAWCEVVALDGTVGEDVRPLEPRGWATMDDDARRRYVAAEAERRTARLAVERKGPGRFTATSRGVKRFRLLLVEGDFEAGKPVVVEWNGVATTRTVAPTRTLLLKEFVERFDRRFLPVAEVFVP